MELEEDGEIAAFFDLANLNCTEENGLEEKIHRDYKLSGYSAVTKDSKHEAEIYFSVLKPYRLRCFEVAINLLHQLEVPYFLSYGTLLSVFRDNGVMIPYDHDTDLVISEKDYVKVVKNKHLLPKGFTMSTKCCETAFQWMRTRRQDIKFDAENPQGNMKMLKVIDNRDYSHLLEECRRKEKLVNPPKTFHCGVFTDFYTYRECGKYIFENIAGCGMEGETPLLKDKVFPTKIEKFEGIECHVPNDPEYVLTLRYGYLGKDFYFDDKTYKYKKIET